MKHRAESNGAVTVAVVGHRRNRLPPERLPQLGATIHELLAELDAATGDRPKILVTGMADGADLMAARERPTNWGLHAILTEPMEVIAGRMQQADAIELRRLLAAPEVRSTVLASGSTSYAGQAGAILDRADLLLAVWDGKPGSGPGGTADSILRALERAIPVLWLPSDGGVARRIEAIANGEPSNRMFGPDELRAIFTTEPAGKSPA